MFNKSFLVKLGKEALVAFIVTTGGVFLAAPNGAGLTTSVLSGAVVAGLRAVVGVLVKDVGEAGTPSL